jgi:biotin synthase
MSTPRTLGEIRALYELPLPELMFRAQQVHRENNDPNDIELCALESVKTGGCSEDCSYCAQSARHPAPVPAEPIKSVEDVLANARRAKELGASRFCMGTAWRSVRGGSQFESVLEMVSGVRDLGMEACVTLGMLTEEQAFHLKEAGLNVYNHNLDTSRRHYPHIVTTHTFEDRLSTIEAVRRAGLAVCCGGIIGMGEEVEDRLMLLTELRALDPPPESIPINSLMPMEGTPLESAPPVDELELVRVIATTRITFPTSRVRLSAGRDRMSRELQVLCFLAGANSIFLGEKLLTASNPSATDDTELFRALGIARPLPAT